MWALRALGALALLAAAPGPVLAAPDCPIQGSVYPIPKNASGHAAIRAAAANMTALFDALAAGGDIPATNVSWSIQAWSSYEYKNLFEHYHTATNLGSLNNSGVTKVGPDTVYRLGSLTKVFTVYTWLVADGDIKWTTPITEYVEELREIQARQARDGTYSIDWDAVTVGALMSQMSGIPRDYTLLGELTQDYKPSDLVGIGFPPLTAQETPKCGEWPLCNRTEFFAALPKMTPTFPVDATPAYSNIAYQILGYALEKIKGRNWEDMLKDGVLRPLGLNHTYYSMPTNSREVGIIPGNFTETGWGNVLGDESPMYSSAQDMTNLGRAILRSSGLPPAMTRRWLKPVAFTSDPNAGMSTPWGIRRININNHPYRWVYGFQKAGTIGRYSALIILLPEYGAGITVFMSGNMPGNFNFDSADAIGSVFIPALEQAAKDEANAMYAGTYLPAPDSPAPNSTVVIVTDDKPGLGVTAWYSNNTNMLYLSVMLQLQTTSTDITPSVRLYPTGLDQFREDATRTQSWKAVFQNSASPPRTGRLFSTDCSSWLSVTQTMYGALPLDEFVFNLDTKGRVVSITNLALRSTLYKTPGPS